MPSSAPSQTRSYTLSGDASQPVTSATSTFSLGGRTFSSVFGGPSRSVVQTSPAGRTLTWHYDARGHVTGTEIPGIAPIGFGYDTTGLATMVTQLNRTMTFGYDAQRRLHSVTDPMQHTISFDYDTADRITRQTLADGRSIQFTYDASGNLTSVVPPGRPPHLFAYTPVDLASSYTPPAVTNGGATQYTYDKDRQLTLVSRPDGRSVSLGYDSAGRLSTLAIARGTYGYTYDFGGRVGSVTAPDGGSSIYSYDGTLLVSADYSGDVSGSIQWIYDNDLAVAREVVTCASAATAACQPVVFSYDSDKLLTAAGALTSDPLLTAAGALTLTRDPQNGLVTGAVVENARDAWTYNTLGEPLTYIASIAGTGTLFSEQFQRDDVGRIVQKSETVNGTLTTASYTYDAAGRLTDVSGDQAAHYTYDANSNRLARISGTQTDIGAYDSQDRCATYGGATYSYSANGELQTKSDASGTTAYSYDELGNLLRVVLPSGQTVDYVVDGQNRRIGKKVDGTLVQSLIYADQLHPAAELDTDGNVVSRFIYGSRPNVPDLIVKGDTTYRVISDHLGSPRLVVDSVTGTVAEQIDYDEFGNVGSDSNPGFQPFGFAGGLYDRDTRLVRFGARDYDPQSGRWTTKDPIGFSGGDGELYGYVGNDPVNFIDPTGLDEVTADAHVQEAVLALWKAAHNGLDPYEQFAWIMQDPTTGRYSCKRLPMTYQQNEFTIKKDVQIPPNVIAVIHTHPRVGNRTTEPDDPGDIVAANAFHRIAPGVGALYTITYKGVGKYVPGATHGTQEEKSLKFPGASGNRVD